MEVTTRKRNVRFTIEQRSAIHTRSLEKPKLKHEELAYWAKVEFDLFEAPTKSTISKMLKRMAECGPGDFTQDSKRARARKAKWPVSYLTIYNKLDYFYLLFRAKET